MPDIEYELYQLPVTAPGCFRPVGDDTAKAIVDLTSYDKVFSGTVTDGGDKVILEHLFRRHNADDRPDAQACRSMSASDVVVLRRPGGAACYACDVFGFTKLPNCKP